MFSDNLKSNALDEMLKKQAAYDADLRSAAAAGLVGSNFDGFAGPRELGYFPVKDPAFVVVGDRLARVVGFRLKVLGKEETAGAHVKSFTFGGYVVAAVPVHECYFRFSNPSDALALKQQFEKSSYSCGCASDSESDYERD